MEEFGPRKKRSKQKPQSQFKNIREVKLKEKKHWSHKVQHLANLTNARKKHGTVIQILLKILRRYGSNQYNEDVRADERQSKEKKTKENKRTMRSRFRPYTVEERKEKLPRRGERVLLRFKPTREVTNLEKIRVIENHRDPRTVHQQKKVAPQELEE